VNFLRRLFGQTEEEDAFTPRVPEGARIYAIGDIHGRADLLTEVMELIAADLQRQMPETAATVLLGDYVDRGPDSKGVLDVLAADQFPTVIMPLMGNHEAMLLSFLADPGTGLWAKNGGVETVHSYGVDARPFRGGRALEETARALREAMPAEHVQFLRSLRISYSIGDYFFCHAGVRPGVPLEQQAEHDLLWIREAFLSNEKSYGKVVVHGHTPGMEPEIHPNRINIDTGAYVSGRLTCLVLEGSTQRFLSTGQTAKRRAPSQH
jgi:serine/threonine protein phosphatase 1